MSDETLDSMPTAPLPSRSRNLSVWTVHMWRLPRYLLLGILLAVAVIFLFSFYRECVDVITIAADGSTTHTTTCSPPSVSSGPLLVFLLAIVSLLWPDLAEVTVLGVGLKRQVDAAASKAEAAKQHADVLGEAIQVQNLRIQALTSSSATSAAIFNIDGRFLNGERAEEIRRAGAENVAATPVSDGVSNETLMLTILSNWERLNELLGLSVRTRLNRREATTLVGNIGDDVRRELTEEFTEDHERSIRLTRDLRNSIAHARPVDRETLVAGEALLRDLLESAKQQFDNSDQST